MGLLSIENVSRIYKQGEEKVYALNNINFNIDEGEFVAIVGPSGSGKSTLLNLLGGMDNPSEGNIYINDSCLNKLNDKELSLYRRKNIGFIFQDFNLIPVLNIRENILFPVKLNKAKIDKEYINDIVETLGLKERLKHYPNEISGGQMQRVAIARALANKPKVILADEPTGNLDSETSDKVIDLLKYFNKKYKQTLIMITHDNSIAERADRIITIKDGLMKEGI